MLILPTRRKFLLGAAATAVCSALQPCPAQAAFSPTPLSQTTFQTPSGGGTVASNTNGGSLINTTGAKLLILLIAGGQSAIHSIADSLLNSGWTFLTNYTNASDSGSVIAYCENPTVGANYFLTLSTNSNSFLTCTLQAWAGAKTSGAFDVENGNTGSGTTLQPGSVLPSQSGSLIVTCFSTGSASSGIAINSGFSTPTGAYLNGLGNAYGGWAAYLVQGAAASVNPTWSVGQSGNRSAAIAVFKPVAAAAGAKGSFSLTGVGGG